MTPGQPIRVLVVDDSILTRRVISAALATAPDVTVVGTAGSGAQCLESVESLQPDVVTLDVEMPGHERPGGPASGDGQAAAPGHHGLVPDP